MPQADPKDPVGNRTRWARWSKRLIEFFVGQGLIQLLGLITGFLFLRWLSVEAYAQFGVAFGFQCTLVLLADLGLSSCVIALVGERFADPRVVGAYIRAGRFQRNQFFLAAIPLSAIAFHVLATRQRWDLRTEALLFASIVFGLFFQGMASFYTAPLFMHHRLRQYYNAQLVAGAGRLGGGWFLHLASALTSVTTAWLGSIATTVSAFICYRASRPLIVEPEYPDPALRREMLRYIAPIIPGAVFFAFQGQISIFIISFFGHTKSVAEIAALGRLGQLLGIIASINGVLIGPYVAKLSVREFPRRYFQIVLGGTLICVVLVFAAFAFPSALLLLLGPKYSHLRRETGFSLLAWSINYLSGLVYILHLSRKWVYWWGSAAQIAVVCLIQIFCVITMDLNSTMSVLHFSVFSSLGTLLVQAIIGIYGLKFGPPKGLQQANG